MCFSVCVLSRWEINVQEKSIPDTHPMAGQMALNPEAKAKPGKPIKSQALSPEALSLKETS